VVVGNGLSDHGATACYAGRECKSTTVWSREDLDEIARNLAVLSEPAVREVYQRESRMRHNQLPHISVRALDAGVGDGVEAAEEVAVPLSALRSLAAPVFACLPTRKEAG
jgi:hypothetical protein